MNKMLADLKKDHYSYTTPVELSLGKAVRITPTSSAWIELIKVRTDLHEAEFVIRIKGEKESGYFGVTSVSNHISFCPLIASRALQLSSLTSTSAIINVYGVERK